MYMNLETLLFKVECYLMNIVNNVVHDRYCCIEDHAMNFEGYNYIHMFFL